MEDNNTSMETVSFLTLNGQTREIADIQNRNNLLNTQNRIDNFENNINDSILNIESNVNLLKERINKLELMTIPDLDILSILDFHFDINNYQQLSWLAKRGNAADYINIGDQVTVFWIPNSNSSAVYNLPFNVVAINLPIIDENGQEVSNNIWLQSHYALESMTFDRQGSNYIYNAFYVPSTNMSPGTYFFTTILSNNNGPFVNNGNYYFTLTKEVPAGGQLVFHDTASNWSSNLSNWSIQSYNNAFRLSADKLEEVQLNSGQSGTKLGDLKEDINYSSTGMNSLNRIRYGYNRYSFSNPRQWCNGIEKSGQWWKPLNSFSGGYSSVSDKNGFMSGLSKEFLDIIKPIKITTKLNTVSNVSSNEITTDYFFLPSLKQMGYSDNDSIDETWPYWENISNSNKKFYRYNYTSSTAVNIWTRSSKLDSDYIQYINNNNNGYGITTNYITPCCVIY